MNDRIIAKAPPLFSWNYSLFGIIASGNVINLSVFGVQGKHGRL